VRKVDRAGVLADFQNSCTDLVARFDRLVASATATTTSDGDISFLATQSFLTLFVSFERFCSDLVLAYMNADFSKYQADLASRIDASIAGKFNSATAALVKFNPKLHVSVSELEELVDPTGWNLTFQTTSKLKEFATKSLIDAHAARINAITLPEGRLIDSARAIRDFIAHQSRGSKARMNDCLSTIEVGGHNNHLGRGVNEVRLVGVYLKAEHGGQMRLHRYSQGLLAIAAGM